MQRNTGIKLGLALSGGGARGLAHIGVLRALEKANIHPDYLTGSSMGGVIAAGYASGLSSADLEQIALEYGSTRKLLRLADPTLPRRGLFQGERLRAFFEQHLRGCTFADLHIPLALVTVDLNSGQEVHLREGSLADAVRATVSVPGYDFMGGPFISYTFVDPQLERVITVDGYVYNPGGLKRNFIRQLEAIIHTIDFRSKEN